MMNEEICVISARKAIRKPIVKFHTNKNVIGNPQSAKNLVHDNYEAEECSAHELRKFLQSITKNWKICWFFNLFCHVS